MCVGPDEFLHLVHVGNAVGPLRQRLHEGDLIHVLRGIALAYFALLHAADADHRQIAAQRAADSGSQIGDARTFRGRHHRRFAGGLGEAVGHEGRPLLVSGEDEADLRRFAQGIENREILRAGDAEHMIDAFAQQTVDEGARAGHSIGDLGLGAECHEYLLLPAGCGGIDDARCDRGDRAGGAASLSRLAATVQAASARGW
jgi:hypothetical protein